MFNTKLKTSIVNTQKFIFLVVGVIYINYTNLFSVHFLLYVLNIIGVHLFMYRLGTVNSNTVNSKFHLIRSCCEYLARFLSFHV